MKMYIPEIGDRIELTADWSFELMHEWRNSDLLSIFGVTKEKWTDWYDNKHEVLPITLPKGTALKVDRIYIRKGAASFSSVTFYIEKGKLKSRFWAKLKDVNNIQFKVIDTHPNTAPQKSKSIVWEWSSYNPQHKYVGYVGIVNGKERFVVQFKETRKIEFQKPVLVRDPLNKGFWMNDPSGKTETSYYTREYFDLYDGKTLIGCYSGTEGAKAKASSIIRKKSN